MHLYYLFLWNFEIFFSSHCLQHLLPSTERMNNYASISSRMTSSTVNRPAPNVVDLSPESEFQPPLAPIHWKSSTQKQEPWHAAYYFPNKSENIFVTWLEEYGREEWRWRRRTGRFSLGGRRRCSCRCANCRGAGRWQFLFPSSSL